MNACILSCKGKRAKGLISCSIFLLPPKGSWQLANGWVHLSVDSRATQPWTRILFCICLNFSPPSWAYNGTYSPCSAFSLPFLGVCPWFRSERVESSRLGASLRNSDPRKRHQSFPLLSELTPLRVSASRLPARTTAPGGGTESRVCTSMNLHNLLRGCIPRCGVGLTHWRELPVKFSKPQVTWILTCTIHRHHHPYTFCYKKTNGEREGPWADALSNHYPVTQTAREPLKA